MTLHPNMSKSELAEYCALCHEFGQRARLVKVDAKTMKHIRQMSNYSAVGGHVFMGITFTTKEVDK